MPTYKALSTVTVGAGGAASIEFTNIPQTFTDLVIKASLRDTRNAAANDFSLQINGSAANRTYRVLKGDGSSATSFNGSDALLAVGDSSTATSNTFGNTEIYIPNYTSSDNKPLFADSVTENNATAAEQWIAASIWSQTSAITSLKLVPGVTGSPSFSQYSTATLYGISNIEVSTIPSKPAIGAVSTNGPQQATVAFTSVPNAVSYTVTPSVGSVSATGISSPISISDLTAGSSQTFTVKANNQYGSSYSSNTSNAITPAGGFESIATGVGTGSGTEITFSSIPSGYTHLQIRGVCRNTTSGYSGIQTFYVRFNGDTGNNYSWSYGGAFNEPTSTTTANSSNTSDTYMYLGQWNVSNGGISNGLGMCVLDIDYYSGDKHKSVRAYGGISQNGITSPNSPNSALTFGAGNWRNTSAINSITIGTSGGGGSWTTTTQFALYGIRAAS